MVLAWMVGIGVQLAGAVELAQDGYDAAGAMHVLDVVLVGGGRDLAQLRHDARQAVDVLHREVDPGFLRDGEQVQDGVGRAAHRDVERDRVLERLEADRARQHRLVVLLRSSAGTARPPAGRRVEQLLAVGVVATTVPLPGKDRPSASVRQFIELAVNMPEQEPQVGRPSARPRPGRRR